MGTIGQEIVIYEQDLDLVCQRLNSVSRFDFGILKCLEYAKDWQAKLNFPNLLKFGSTIIAGILLAL
jgi:hypothetical protein